MRFLPVVLALVFTAGAVGEAVAQGPRGRGDQEAVRYGWQFSLSAGKAQARKSGKPLMVVMRCVP